jgi:CRP-like cAMP-binding protein
VPDPESLDSNRLWAAMKTADQEALRPHMTLRHLPRGDVLTGIGEPVEIVYFPVTADLANVIPFSDGRRGMATNVGREGVSGLAAFLADEPCGWDVQVQIGGAAWALPSEALRAQVDASDNLLTLLLSLTHFNQIEAAQNAVCSAVHTVTPKVARWLLTVQDRIGLDRFPITQDDVGALIAARRTTVNASWQELRSAGAIGYSRGTVAIVDRGKLKGLACECYAALAARADGVHR